MSAIEGRTVLVTGAASGIGKALVEGFLRDGARVVACDVNAQGLVSLAQAGALTEQVDVCARAEVEALIERAQRETGRLDVLFNNAGTAGYGTLESTDPERFEHTIAVHLFGTVYGMHAALPLMRAAGHGRIVNTLSRAAEINGPGTSAYAAAKAALWAVTRAVARETADTDILVNGLIPGPTNTAIWGRDMPNLQPPEVVYPTALMLATLPPGGPTGRVFWDEKVYPLMDPANARPSR